MSTRRVLTTGFVHLLIPLMTLLLVQTGHLAAVEQAASGSEREADVNRPEESAAGKPPMTAPRVEPPAAIKGLGSGRLQRAREGRPRIRLESARSARRPPTVPGTRGTAEGAGRNPRAGRSTGSAERPAPPAQPAAPTPAAAEK